jgi:4-hydroxyphenylacetate 3-monooxygenase
LKQDGIAVVRRAHHAVGAKPITESCSEMIRTGAQYREGLRDGREVWIDGERVKDIASHPATKLIVDIRSRMYDMQHEAAYVPTLTYEEGGARHSIFNRLPKEQRDWHDKWKAVDAVMSYIKGVVTRVGDETVGEMWSLYDGRDVLNEIDPQFAANISRHIHGVIETDVFQSPPTPTPRETAPSRRKSRTPT